MSGHAGLKGEDFEALARSISGTASGTLVILMGTRKLRDICDGLARAGADSAVPVAIVHACFLPEQLLLNGTLSTIVDVAAAHGRPLSPAIIIVGQVAKFAQYD